MKPPVIRSILAVMLAGAVPLGAQASDPAQPRADVIAPAVPPLDTVAPTMVDPVSVSSPRPAVTSGFVLLASREEDRLRLRQVLGEAPIEGYLLRAPSTLSVFAADSIRGISAIVPRVETVVNSGLPFTFNDGPLWAGRGVNLQVTGGARMAYGPVVLILAPQLVYEQNREYQIVPYLNPNDRRKRFAHPYHTNPESLDIPTRFGDEPRLLVYPGQSSVTFHTRRVAFGLATENLWWGPGIRNAIVMSSHAGGIPHAFVRTAEPLKTRIGNFEATWRFGWLTESAFFDSIPRNDRRSFSAIAATYRPSGAPNLTVGFTRAVYGPLNDLSNAPGRAFSAFGPVGHPNDRSPHDLSRPPHLDQVFSLFGRWIFPADGLEVYGEWARTEAPRSFRDLLLLPSHTQGYTVGLQWARPVREGSLVRLQGELTNLETGSSYRQRRSAGFYKSRPVPQGYTQDGQVIGASVGTGGTSQWLAADYLGERWEVGLFGGRIRWDNDAYYGSQPRFPLAHDVSIFGGLRGSYESPLARVDLEASTGTRFNFLFQFNWPTPERPIPSGIDFRNHSLRLTITPRG